MQRARILEDVLVRMFMICPMRVTVVCDQCGRIKVASTYFNYSGRWYTPNQLVRVAARLMGMPHEEMAALDIQTEGDDSEG